MADTDPAQSLAPLAGPSRSSTSRTDMEGLGKFKVRQYQRSSSAPQKGGSTYKSKFFVLKETYDTVAAKHDELLRELQIANSKLKSVQAENDLLLDAMQIVAPSQPTLINILQQMEPEPLSGSAEVYPHHRASYVPAPPPSDYGPGVLQPEQMRHAELLAEAPPPPPLNGNGSELSHGHGHGHGHNHSHSHGHSHHHSTNGRRRRASRDYREPMSEPADQEMLDVEQEIVDHEYAVPPPGTNAVADGR